MRGDRGLLTGYLWIPTAEIMALAPSLVARPYTELELRVPGFFRSEGRIQSPEFKMQMSAHEDWVVEMQESERPGD